MKTAISIPDPVFEQTEALAKRLGVSRSHLYVEALKKLVAAYGHVHVRDVLDRVYGKDDSKLDAGVSRAQSKALSRDRW